MQTILEARRAAPAILLLPHLHLWWATAPSSLKTTLQVRHGCHCMLKLDQGTGMYEPLRWRAAGYCIFMCLAEPASSACRSHSWLLPVWQHLLPRDHARAGL